MTLLDQEAWSGRLFSDGWVPGAEGEIPVVEPATGEELGRVGAAGAADVAQAAARAAEAQRAWAAAMYQERAAVLRRAGDLFNEHGEEIQDWIVRETGAIPPKAQLETWFAASTCYEAAGLASHAVRRAAPHPRPRPLDVAAHARGRRGGHLAVQLPADPVDPRGRAGARARQRGRPEAGPPHGGVRRRDRWPASSRRPACPRGCCQRAPRRRRDRRGSSSDPDVQMISFTGSTRGGAHGRGARRASTSSGSTSSSAATRR